MSTKIKLSLWAVAMSVAVSAFADGDAPHYGNCTPTGQHGSLQLQTLEPGTLTVATVLPNPGWYNGQSPSSTKDGFEYCMAAEIAHRAGLQKLRLINLAWDQYISGTAKGYDLAIASTTITEPRKKVFNFSRPYYSSNLAVAVKASSNLETTEQLKTQRIGVLQGNMGSEWVARTLKPSPPAKVYQTQPDLITALLAGQIDAIITDTTVVLSATHGSRGAVKVIGQFQLDQGYGVVTPKGSANTEAIDSAVGAMNEDGTLTRLSALYLKPLFGVDPNSIPLWQLP